MSNKIGRFFLNSYYMLIYQVKYDATNFLEKNRDTLSPDIIHVLRSSGKEFVIIHVNY